MQKMPEREAGMTIPDCGRSARRGSYPCLECLKESLTVYVGINLASAYIQSIKILRLIEASMEDKQNE